MHSGRFLVLRGRIDNARQISLSDPNYEARRSIIPTTVHLIVSYKTAFVRCWLSDWFRFVSHFHPFLELYGWMSRRRQIISDALNVYVLSTYLFCAVQRRMMDESASQDAVLSLGIMRSVSAMPLILIAAREYGSL